MTNAQLNTSISNINDGGVNTAQEVRQVFTDVKNEMFNTTHIQEVASNGSNFNYKLTFEKIGNICFVSGVIKNETNTILDASNYTITINNLIYYPKTNVSNIINSRDNTAFIINSFPNMISFAQYINNEYQLNAVIPIGATFNFNGHYKIND